jgi:hypothetical protein
MLIDAGADVNAQGGIHGNALHVASLRGYDEVEQINVQPEELELIFDLRVAVSHAVSRIQLIRPLYKNSCRIHLAYLASSLHILSTPPFHCSR